jgi:hypothetical protein
MIDEPLGCPRTVMSQNVARGCDGVTGTFLIIDAPSAGPASYLAHFPSYGRERVHQVPRRFWRLRVLTGIDEGSGTRNHCHRRLNS